MKTQRIRATIKAIPVYVCIDCKKACGGDTMYFEIDVVDEWDLVSAIQNKGKSVGGMPVGWSHDTQYHCGCIWRDQP